MKFSVAKDLGTDPPDLMEQIPQTSFTLSATQGNFFPLESENPLDLSEMVLEIDEIITESQGGHLKDHSSFGGAGSYKI